MTKTQEKKLDAFFQQAGMHRCKGLSVLSGKPAEVVHHFVGRRNKATRWYLPNAIPLTDDEHKYLEYCERREQSELVIQRLGTYWYDELMYQANRPAKYLEYETVLAHLRGECDNYIPTWYV